MKARLSFRAPVGVSLSADAQSRALARRSHHLDNDERAVVVHVARELKLPVTPILQTWAELADAERGAA